MAAISLVPPQVPAPLMPPPRLTSYRYWEHYQADALHAIHDALGRVLSDKER
ncbi:MAG: hypothetical protein LAQ69_47445 [Acidobacteriia bacterium]|nr:hypothetical protein [Terriglobia bacterium]